MVPSGFALYVSIGCSMLPEACAAVKQTSKHIAAALCNSQQQWLPQQWEALTAVLKTLHLQSLGAPHNRLAAAIARLQQRTGDAGQATAKAAVILRPAAAAAAAATNHQPLQLLGQQHWCAMDVPAHLQGFCPRRGGVFLPQQQQQLHAHTAAAAAGLRAYSTQEQQQWQPLSSRHKKGPPPWQTMGDKELAQLLSRASAASSRGQQHAVLLQALRSMMQRLPGVLPADQAALLSCFEMAGLAVPLQDMQRLLMHMQQHHQQYASQQIVRALRSASHARLAANRGHSNSSSKWQQRQHKLPSLGVLLQQARHPTAAGSTQGALPPSAVPQLLRCAAILQHPRQKLPAALLDDLTRYWLSCSTAAHGSTPDHAANSSSGSRIGAGQQQQQERQQQQQQQVAQQAAMLVTALHKLDHKLLLPDVERVLRPLLSALPPSIMHHPLSRQASSSRNNSRSSSGSARSPVGAAVDACEWLPPLLLATHCLDRNHALPEQQRAYALQAVSSTLRTLATAAAAADPATSSQALDPATSTSSRASSTGQESSLQAVADSIVVLLRGLAAVQRASPLHKVPGLLDNLAAVLLAADAPFTQLSTFLSYCAALNQAPSIASMAAITAHAVQQLQQQQGPQQHQGLPPRQQQQQQQCSSGSGSIGKFLWSCATLGFSLGQAELQALLRQQLAVLQAPAALSVSQTLWSLAHMGPDPQQLWQQQKQQLVPQPHDACSSGLSSRVSQLACELLSAVLSEQQAAAAAAGSAANAAANANRGSSSGSREPDTVAESWSDQAAPGSSHSILGHTAWQLSLLAWASAMCDLSMCKDTVLGLCKALAQPSMWKDLRKSELVQLVAVHVWLKGMEGGGNVDITQGGLAAVLSQEQLQLMLAARHVLAAAVMKSGLGYQQQQQRQGAAGSVAAAAAAGALAFDGSYAQQLAGMPQQSQPELPAHSRRAAAALARNASNSTSSSSTSSSSSISGASVAQVAVWKALRAVPGVRSAQLEAVTPDGMFNLDILVTLSSGQQLVVEFDGPFHWAVAVPSAGSTAAAADTSPHSSTHGMQPQQDGRRAVKQANLALSRPPQQQQQQPQGQRQPRWQQQGQQQFVPVRRVLFRNRALTARGHRVLCVPYFEWLRCTSQSQRVKYMSRLLADAQAAAAPVALEC